MLPEASTEGNIPTKGEQHACYIAEHLTIDLLCHYHMYTCNITAHVKGISLGYMYKLFRPIHHGIYRLFVAKYAVVT